jgi:hypothetical protein
MHDMLLYTYHVLASFTRLVHNLYQFAERFRLLVCQRALTHVIDKSGHASVWAEYCELGSDELESRSEDELLPNTHTQK